MSYKNVSDEAKELFSIENVNLDLVPLNVNEVVEDIKSLVIQSVKTKDGILIPISGGLDSTTTIFLTALALEKLGNNKKLVLVYMPTETTGPDTINFIEDVYSKTKDIYSNCSLEEISITRELEDNLTYQESLNIFNSIMNSKEKLDETIKNENLKNIGKPMAVNLTNEDFAPIIRQVTAYIGITNTLRAKKALEYREKNNLILASCGNRTEHELNLFNRGGIDDVGDIRPIEPYFKTQVKEIARHINVPVSIIQRIPTADVSSGTENGTSDEEWFGAPYIIIDYILFQNQKGKTKKQIIEDLKKYYELFVEIVKKLRGGKETSSEEVVEDILNIYEWARTQYYCGTAKE